MSWLYHSDGVVREQRTRTLLGQAETIEQVRELLRAAASEEAETLSFLSPEDEKLQPEATPFKTGSIDTEFIGKGEQGGGGRRKRKRDEKEMDQEEDDTPAALMPAALSRAEARRIRKRDGSDGSRAEARAKKN